MKLAGSAAALAVTALVAAGCSTSHSVGSALLPDGVEDARLPDVEMTSYLYVNPAGPMTLPVELMGATGDADRPADSAPMTSLGVDKAAIFVGPKAGGFGSIVDFASELHAREGLRLFRSGIQGEGNWASVSANELTMAVGDDAWTQSVRSALDSGSVVTLREHPTLSWDVVTNLPENPPSPPVAIGVVNLDYGLSGALMNAIDFDLSIIETAFALVRVDILGFGIYTDAPIEVPESFDREFLADSVYGVLLVSNSDYSGVVVAYMLGVIADRVGMETVGIGSTNARYRTSDGIHFVLKNKGAIVFAALAADRQHAVNLILSAITD